MHATSHPIFARVTEGEALRSASCAWVLAWRVPPASAPVLPRATAVRRACPI